MSPAVPRRRAWHWGLLAPLPAIAVGAAIAAIYGVAWTAYLPNVAAVVLGVVGYVVVVRARTSVVWLAVVAAAAIVATLIGPDLEGVHRWLAVGPVRLNASAAFAPWILFALAQVGLARHRHTSIVVVLAVIAVQVVHVVQPDAGQATAFAVGVLPLVLDRGQVRPTIGIPLAIVSCVLAAVAWSRADPLAPVDHVERILWLGASLGPLWIAAMTVVCVLLVAPFVVAWAGRAHISVVLAAVGYVVATFVVTFVGSFPVPILGAGAAPVLGWYALLAVHRRTCAA